MKLLICILCSDINALSKRPKKCDCGKTGGYYNDDGDTATIWGPSKLLGLSNRAIMPAAMSDSREVLRTMTGDQVLWPYYKDHKITRLDEEPAHVQTA